MKLYQRLGLKEKEMPLEMTIEGLHKELEACKDNKDLPSAKFFVVSDCHLIALDFYYLEKIDKSKIYAHLMLDYTCEYFFGKWREETPVHNGPANAFTNKKLVKNWGPEFREAIFWASCLGEWDKAGKISEYPTDECPIGYDEPKQFRAWWLIVAAVLRGESLENLTRHTDVIDKGRKKYQKLLLAMLRPLLAGDSEGFNKELKIYLEYCDNNTFNKIEIDEKISIDGTFLINLARHRGLTVEYPAEYEDRIVKLK
ncbi:MAG: hypothetical protein IID32_05845 [Planctomycetes bacterium]|nr:hypothetical protein [Planctomycetota bacterium]